ncbi:hypothetical protein [Clostridium perfringens]
MTQKTISYSVRIFEKDKKKFQNLIKNGNKSADLLHSMIENYEIKYHLKENKIEDKYPVDMLSKLIEKYKDGKIYKVNILEINFIIAAIDNNLYSNSLDNYEIGKELNYINSVVKYAYIEEKNFKFDSFNTYIGKKIDQDNYLIFDNKFDLYNNIKILNNNEKNFLEYKIGTEFLEKNIKEINIKDIDELINCYKLELKENLPKRSFFRMKFKGEYNNHINRMEFIILSINENNEYYSYDANNEDISYEEFLEYNSWNAFYNEEDDNIYLFYNKNIVGIVLNYYYACTYYNIIEKDIDYDDRIENIKKVLSKKKGYFI